MENLLPLPPEYLDVYYHARLKIYLFILCLGVFSPHVYLPVHYLCSWCPWRPEKGARSFGTGVTISCEPPPRGYWETNLGHLEEQPMLLTTGSPLQSQVCFLWALSCCVWCRKWCHKLKCRTRHDTVVPNLQVCQFPFLTRPSVLLAATLIP